MLNVALRKSGWIMDLPGNFFELKYFLANVEIYFCGYFRALTINQ